MHAVVDYMDRMPMDLFSIFHKTKVKGISAEVEKANCKEI